MILFFYGPNSYASRRQLQAMIKTYKKKTGSDLGLERIDGIATDAKSLVAALRAVPFLATSRLVIVEYLGANKAASVKIAEITKDIPETTVAVFYEKEIDKRTAYFKHLEAQAQVQQFWLLSPAQLAIWIQAQLKELGATIAPAALAELVDRTGDDQWRLEQELGKLANYAKQISRADVQLLVEAGRDENIFGLVEAIAAGRTNQALTQYQLLLAGGAAEMYMLSMIIWQLRNLLLAKTAGVVAPGELARAAGMSPFVAQKSLNRISGIDQERLKQAFLAAIHTEYKIKTGQGKPEELVELLIYQLAGAMTDSGR